MIYFLSLCVKYVVAISYLHHLSAADTTAACLYRMLRIPRPLLQHGGSGLLVARLGAFGVPAGGGDLRCHCQDCRVVPGVIVGGGGPPRVILRLRHAVPDKLVQLADLGALPGAFLRLLICQPFPLFCEVDAGGAAGAVACEGEGHCGISFQNVSNLPTGYYRKYILSI